MLIDQCAPWEKSSPDGPSGQELLVATMRSQKASLMRAVVRHASFVGPLNVINGEESVGNSAKLRPTL